MKSEKLCLVGAGNMGGAMLAGWLAAGHEPAALTVIDPKPSKALEQMFSDYGINHGVDASKVDMPDLIVVAVKPQIITAVLPTITRLVSNDNAVLSVAAGTPIAALAAPFSAVQPRIIRAMPNTPAMVQRGITVCVGNERVSAEQKDMVSKVLSAIGQVEWVDDERLIDAVTGVSGSGPAYVFHLTEALTKAGVTAGLDAELASTLALATVSGAGELMRQSDLAPAQLRENVTSPNGTTAAALEVLMGEGGFPELLEKAVEAATQRSRELASE